jgi:pyruvate/2-oxoglutarate dehydrogenase complex dihydrolipoamide dehydrogenase (E3) component
MADEHYDAIVIGTSQGGRFLPVELAKAGRKVALVERDALGGVCVNRGCTPTKTMVASARLAYLARRGAEYGVRTGPVSVDLAAVRERKRAMVAGARENYASRLSQQGLDLIAGEARFTGPNTVEITLADGGAHARRGRHPAHRPGLHRGRRVPADQRPWRLRDGGRQGRPGLHPPLL